MSRSLAVVVVVVVMAALVGCPIAGSQVPGFGAPCTTSCPSGFACDAKLKACVPEAAGAINTFVVDHEAVAPGESFNLSWTTTNLSQCNISGGIGPVDDNGTVAHSEAALGAHPYVLTCTGSQGAVASDPVTVTVANALEGDVDIENDADLAAIDSVQSITGSLTFGKHGTCSITKLDALRDLASVGHDIDYECHGLTTIDLPALTTVGGSFTIGGGDETLENLHADALTDVHNDLIVENFANLGHATFTALQTVGRDLFVSTYAYPSYPNTDDAVALILPSLIELDMPELQSIGRDFDCEDAGALQVLSFPKLTSVSASFIVYGLGSELSGEDVSI
ncbi:MAG TPA: hypothetical protein VGO62_01735, partial [Myxococcota bacterium]